MFCAATRGSVMASPTAGPTSSSLRPYANNYDYADATRLEMTLLGEIDGWGDLQEAVRSRLVRSCTQHVGRIAARTSEVVGDPSLAPIAVELTDVCSRLAKEREGHGGKKQYHAMVAYYFHDLARVWRALRRVTRAGGRSASSSAIPRRTGSTSRWIAGWANSRSPRGSARTPSRS